METTITTGERITISKKEYRYLEERAEILKFLEESGVLDGQETEDIMAEYWELKEAPHEW